MNKKNILFAIVWFALFFGLPFLSLFYGVDDEESTGFNDYARITDVEYKAVLVDEPNNGGKVVITEKLTFDIHAASKNNLFWELWRDLPEDYVDGLDIYYKVNYVKQLNNDGTETIYTQSPKLYWDDYDYISPTYGPGKWYHSPGPYSEYQRNYECVFFYVNGLYREKVTFEIQYEMYNAALRYSDVSELYLTMYSEDTIKHLKSFKGQILIPQKDMPQKNNFLAHTYGTNSYTFEYTESDTLNPGYHTFSFDLDKKDLKFKLYNRYLEFTLLSFNEDKHIFTDYAPDNYYSNDVYLEEALEEIEEYDSVAITAKKYKNWVFYGSIIISLLIIISTIKKEKKIKENNNIYSPSMQIQYFRDIPSDLDPHFAATLVFCKHKNKIDVGNSYSAILLNLVRKGYIELNTVDSNKGWVFNNILINILYMPTTPSTLNNVTLSERINAIRFNDANEQYSITNSIQKVENSINSSAEIKPPIERRNIKGDLLEELSTNEQTYFNLIVKYAIQNSNSYNITMKQLQSKVARDYDNTDTFVSSIENSIVNIGVSKGYFQKASYDVIKKSMNALLKKRIVTGILIASLGNLIIYNTPLDFAYGALFILGFAFLFSSIYIKRFANKYVLLTQYGEDEYSKWRGLYNFLNSETLIKERQVIDLHLWEKYLVYATAFGISDKVTKALEICCPDVSNSQILNNNYYRSKSFRSYNHSFRTTTHTASNISRSRRYSSGGSYYGGGGRGGGGGGGGH